MLPLAAVLALAFAWIFFKAKSYGHAMAVLQKLADHHKVMRAAMVTKQTVDPANAQKLRDAILAMGVEPAPEAPSDSGSEPGPLAGKKFVFTGGMSVMGRGEAARLVEEAGGRAVGSVSKATDYVVAGEAPGSKYDRAVELGLTILDETQFLELLRELGVWQDG